MSTGTRMHWTTCWRGVRTIVDEQINFSGKSCCSTLSANHLEHIGARDCAGELWCQLHQTSQRWGIFFDEVCVQGIWWQALSGSPTCGLICQWPHFLCPEVGWQDGTRSIRCAQYLPIFWNCGKTASLPGTAYMACGNNFFKLLFSLLFTYQMIFSPKFIRQHKAHELISCVGKDWSTSTSQICDVVLKPAITSFGL